MNNGPSMEYKVKLDLYWASIKMGPKRVNSEQKEKKRDPKGSGY